MVNHLVKVVQRALSLNFASQMSASHVIVISPNELQLYIGLKYDEFTRPITDLVLLLNVQKYNMQTAITQYIYIIFSIFCIKQRTRLHRRSNTSVLYNKL